MHGSVIASFLLSCGRVCTSKLQRKTVKPQNSPNPSCFTCKKQRHAIFFESRTFARVLGLNRVSIGLRYHGIIRPALKPSSAFLSLGTLPSHFFFFFFSILFVRSSVVSCLGCMVCEWQFSAINQVAYSSTLSHHSQEEITPGKTERRGRGQRYKTVGLSF